MKSKRFLLPFMMLSLCICSWLFFSCPNLASPGQKPSEPSFPIVEGKGSFTLVIGNNGRTILPSTPALTDFAEFTLDFVPAGSGTPVTETRAPADLNTVPVYLDAGTYTLKVTAYLGVGKSNPAMYGELANISIVNGVHSSGTVSLKAIVDNGDGMFSWNIDISAVTVTLTEASIEITPLNTTTGSPAQTLYFIGAAATVSANDLVTLKSGYYNVVFTLTKDNQTQQIVRRDVLHIYQHLNSSIPLVFTDADFSALNYIVEIEYRDGVTNNGIETVNAGGLIPAQPTPTNNSTPNCVFGGWYNKADNAEWNFAVDTVTGDMTLYAKWLTDQDFTFQFEIPNIPPMVDSNIALSTQGLGPQTAKLEVANPAKYTSINWYYNGELRASGAVWEITSVFFGNMGGPKFITVEAEAFGVRFSKLIIITLQVPAARIGSGSTAEFYPTLAKAIEDVPTGTPTTIVLLSDITAPEDVLPGGAVTLYTISAGQDITLTVENNCHLSINASDGNFALFTVAAGGSLTLDALPGSLTLSGGGLTSSPNTSRRGIYVNTNGELAIKNNVTIAGFRCATTTGNYGGGVYLASEAKFTMSGGIIYGNSADINLRNTAYSTGTNSSAAIYVQPQVTGTSPVTGATATFAGNYTGITADNKITSSSDTVPSREVPGTITIEAPEGKVPYKPLYAEYVGSAMVSYQWKSATSSTSTPSNIAGATKPVYVPVPTSTSTTYYYVTVSAPGYLDKTSAYVSMSLKTLGEGIYIYPYGKIDPGTTLTVNYVGNEPAIDNVTVTYHWRQESTEISGATASMYVPTDPGIYPVTVRAPGFSDKPTTATGTGFAPATVLPNGTAYILPGTVTSLTEDKWTDATLSATTQQDWYSIDVSAGTTYRIWLNHRELSTTYTNGDGTKTAYRPKLSAIYDDGKIIHLDGYNFWTNGLSFTPPATFSGTKVYIKVSANEAITSPKTYGIAYSTGTPRPKNDTLNTSTPNGITPTPLSADIWEKGTFSSASPQHWYSISTTAGIIYNVWLNEAESTLSITTTADTTATKIDGVTAADVDATAWFSNADEAFAHVDTKWLTPQKITGNGGTVIIQVRPLSGAASTGVYEIAYSANSVMPVGNHNDWTAPASPVTLTDGTWGGGNITSTSQRDWYVFDVDPGDNFYFWWSDSSSGATGRVYVSACYDNGNVIYLETYSGGYTTPAPADRSFTVPADAHKVYIRVRNYSSLYYGSYGVVFTKTTNARP